MSPVLQLAIATLILGTSGVFIKLAALSPLVMTFFRAGIPLIFVSGLFLYRREPLFWGATPFLLLISFLDAVRGLCYIIGFSYADLSSAVVILYTWPLFTTLLSWIFLKETIPRRNLWLLPCFILGIIVIYADAEISLSSRSFLGLTSVLIAAVLVASTVVMYKVKAADFSVYRLIFYQNLVAGVVSFPFLLGTQPWPNLFQFTMGGIYGISIGIIGFMLFFSALSKLKASTTALLCYLEILSTIVCGIVFFQEELSVNIILGASLILGGSFCLKKTSDVAP
ncbi:MULTISPECIES: DMT family transporter [Cyanophyceae]|uniref:DMT family transporter n=1 Tax=Cyanophyceae TaxID=3028117 RepID=UPI0004AB23A6|nr:MULTISPECIES: DMT family transporter [Cyanophyceae]